MAKGRSTVPSSLTYHLRSLQPCSVTRSLWAMTRSISSRTAVTALPAILVKSALLAGTAGYAARRFNRVSVALLAAVVLFYQIVGSAGEWALTGSFTAAVQDFRIGIPGMLLQVFGGYLFIKYVIRK